MNSEEKMEKAVDESPAPYVTKEEILRAQQIFRDWMLGGIQNVMNANMHLMAFILMSCAIDHLAGYRYPDLGPNNRYPKFIENYFPTKYKLIAVEIYKNLRCKLVHSFSTKGFLLTQDRTELHFLVAGKQVILNSQTFYQDLVFAAIKLFDEVNRDQDIENEMKKKIQEDGAMGIVKAEIDKDI